MIFKQFPMTENKEELTQAFAPGLPIAAYQNTFGADTYDSIGWHWHGAVQYCRVLSGRVAFRSAEQTIVVSEGEGIFIRSKVAHTSAPACPNASYFCLDLETTLVEHSPALSSKCLSVFSPKALPSMQLLLPSFPAHQNLLSCLEEIQFLLAQEPENYEVCLYSLLYRLLGDTLSLPKEQSASSALGVNERLVRLLSYLHCHFAEPIRLETVAGQIHLSESECCRFFRKATGQHLFSYLRRYRLTQSLALLRQTSMSIAEVAQAVGFGSQSYYTECFKKRFGQTPLQFRKRVNFSTQKDAKGLPLAP